MRKYNRKSNGSVFKKILTVFLVIGAVASLGALLGVGNNVDVPNPNPPVGENFKTVYLVPSRDWSEDSSEYAAWCFGVDYPAACHIKGSYNEYIGAIEFKVRKEYTQIIFIDVKAGTGFNGNWDNKRSQTEDLILPEDDNVFYHQYANEWRSDATFSEPEIVVTTENKTVMCATLGDTYLSMYIFNKFTGEGNFIGCEQTDYQAGVCVKTFTIPAGYTHCIFVVHSSEDVSWDNVQSQTADLVIPSDNKILYNLNDNLWVEPVNNEE